MYTFLSKRKINLQTKFIVFTGATFSILFLVLSNTIYQTQKRSILDANEQRMYGHLRDLVNTVNIYYEEQISAINNFGNGFDKLLVETDYGIQETDSIIPISAISFNRADPQNHNKRLDIEVNQWLYMGKSLQNGDHVFVDTQSETFGGLLSIFQHTPYGELVIQSNLRFDGKNRSENVLLNDGPTRAAISGKETIARLKINERWIQALFKPIYFDGRIKGILFIGHPETIVEQAGNIFTQITYFDTGYPYCFNSNNEYTIHPHLQGEKVGHISNIDSLKQQKHGSLRYEHEQGGEKRWKWMFYEYFEPYDMFIAVSVDEKEFMDEPLLKTAIIIFVGFTITLIIGIGGIYFLVRTITRPINHLSEKLQELALGKSIITKFEERNDEIGDIAKAVDKVIGSVNTASAFANEIGNENYQAHFEPLSDDDLLGNSLLHMKNNLEGAKSERDKREWANQGMASFTSIMRESSHNIKVFADQVLKSTIKFLSANQGMLYVLEEDDGQEANMVLMACYAWSRKKYRKSTVMKGEGLVGQAWLEKDIIYMEVVPEDYIKISSGLGDANPNMVLIVPLQFDGMVYGILEIASFKKLKDFEIEFVSKIAESIASTLSSARINEKTRHLLEKTQVMTETLQAQEEEMRQNMEELQATHEQMTRNETSLKKEIEILRKANQQLLTKVQAASTK